MNQTVRVTWLIDRKFLSTPDEFAKELCRDLKGCDISKANWSNPFLSMNLTIKQVETIYTPKELKSTLAVITDTHPWAKVYTSPTFRTRKS